MKLPACYSAHGERLIGRDVECYEPSKRLLSRLLGLGRQKRSRIESELIDRATAFATLDRLGEDDGLFIVDLTDGRSSVDFSFDSGTFFIEQYFDLIYGGLFPYESAREVLEAVFRGCSSEGLRELFPRLAGEHVYEYRDQNA